MEIHEGDPPFVSIKEEMWNSSPSMRGKMAVDFFASCKGLDLSFNTTVVVAKEIFDKPDYIQLPLSFANPALTMDVLYFVTENYKNRIVFIYGGVRSKYLAECLVFTYVYNPMTKLTDQISMVKKSSLTLILFGENSNWKFLSYFDDKRTPYLSIENRESVVTDLIQKRLFYIKKCRDLFSMGIQNKSIMTSSMRSEISNHVCCPTQCSDPKNVCTPWECVACDSFYLSMIYFAQTSQSTQLIKWWAEGETIALRIYLETENVSDSMIFENCEKSPFLKGVFLSCEENDALCLEVAMNTMARTCYRIPFRFCFELQKKCAMKNGFIYVPDHELVGGVIPLVFNSRIFKLASEEYSPIETGPPKEELNHKIQEIRESVSLLHPSLRDSVMEITLPDIEDLHTYMPPCAFAAYTRMMEKKDLKHPQRMNFVNFLRGFGYKEKECSNYILKHSPSMKSESIEEVKWYSSKALPTDSKYGFSSGCDKLATENEDQIPCTGLKVDYYCCPFKFYNDDDLSTLLEKMGIQDQKEREDVLEKRKISNKEGCKEVFNHFAPRGRKLTSFYPSSPHWYSKNLITRLSIAREK